MQRTNLILAMTVASLASFFVWRVTEGGFAMLISVVLLALALAQLYWADFPSAVRQGLLSRYALGLLALCGLAGFILLGALDNALKPPSTLLAHGDSVAARTVQWLGGLVLLIVPVWPLLLSGFRNACRDRPPLWPIIAGLAGGGALWLAGGFAWISLAEPALTRPSEINETALLAVLVLAEAGLVAGVGGAIWLKAIEPRPSAAFDGSRVFAGTIIVTASALGLGMVLTLWGTARELGAVEDLARNGEAWCGVLLVTLAIAWIWVLLRLRDVEPTRSLATIVVVVGLMVLFAVSFAIPSVLIRAREWTPFVVLIVAPVTLLGAILVIAFAPRLIRAVAYR